MKNKLEKLEAIRGFAAIYVMLGHVFINKVTFFGVNFSIIFRFGQEAVILFFLMSGFVIQYSFENSTNKSFSGFFLKRFFRIYIPLLCVFVANIIVVMIEQKSTIPINITELIGNFLMMQDVSSLKQNVICSPFMGNVPLWSLSYEWWFYMIFFFISVKFKKESSKIVLLISLLSVISYLFLPNFINRLLMYLLIWWIGADMAKLYIEKKKITFGSLKYQLLSLTVFIGILTLNIFINRTHIQNDLGISGIGISPFLELRHFLFALIAIVISIIWSRYKWIWFSKTFGLFEPFAGISFGLYISHYFLIVNAKYLDQYIINVTLRYIFYFIICFGFSYLVEKIIYEKLRVNIFNLLGKQKIDTPIIDNIINRKRI
jgi:peptidoglycan/LPS O-acetylase OafA/YrhL